MLSLKMLPYYCSTSFMFSVVLRMELALPPLRVSVCPLALELTSDWLRGSLPQDTCECQKAKTGQPGLRTWEART